jgi:hypothetical protein
MLNDCACAAQCVQGVGDTAVEVRQFVSHGAAPTWDAPILWRLRATRRL